MSDNARFRLGLVLLVLSSLSCVFRAHAAEPGPALDPPLPAPRRLPAGPPVEEAAPAPRELIGPVGPLPAQLPREEPAPMPRDQTPAPPPLLLPGLSNHAPLGEAQRLHQEIENLRMEREAMLLEEIDLITATEAKDGKGNEATRLRQRVTELLIRETQKAKAIASASTPAEPAKHAESGSQEKPAQPRSPDGTRHAPKPLHSLPSASADPSTLPPPKKMASPDAQPTPKTAPSAQVLTETPVDPLSLAQSLFLTGDHAAALEAYRKLEQEEPKPDERIIIEYMMACCLRKLGKLDEAAVLYREVANSHGSDILIENAQWYLRAMKERRELESQLGELRQRRQALTPRKP